MYKVVYSRQAVKDFQKLDKPVAIMLRGWINKNLANSENPRFQGKALKGKLSTFWRYRVGDYRILVLVEDDKLIILVVTVGHRKEVYR